MTAPTKPITKPTAPTVAPAAAAPAKRQRKAPPVPKDETKEQRFRRVAGKRLAKAVRAITQLEAVGRSPNAYGYTTEQADKVISHLVDAVSKVKIAFSAKPSKATVEMVEL